MSDEVYRRVTLNPPITEERTVAVVPTTSIQTITFPDASGWLLSRDEYEDFKAMLAEWRANREEGSER